jgi:inhibitor of cysteine peptidase
MGKNAKRRILCAALAMIVAAGLAGCGTDTANVADGTTQVSVKVGESFDVELAENRTTGYSWAIQISDEDVVSLTRDEYDPDQVPEGTVGSGGTRKLAFTGQAAGSATITLSYERSFEEDSATEVREYTVTVTE